MVPVFEVAKFVEYHVADKMRFQEQQFLVKAYPALGVTAPPDSSLVPD
jgi:hypothetical protein